MRTLFVIVSLAITGVSMSLDYALPRLDSLPDSRLCRAGLCRYDQVFAAVNTDGMGLGNVSAELNLDTSNPLVWCTYAELLSAAGHVPEAASAFEQAVSLGPGVSPVLMRSANFAFAQGRLDQGFALTNRILRQTEAFDQMLFSYLTRTGFTVSKLAGIAVPAEPRAARSWFSWLRGTGSDADLGELWSWMQQNRLLDQKSAQEFAWTFWQRKAFTTAQEAWVEWLGPSRSAYLHPQRLANLRFQDAPDGSPFDWSLTSAPGAAVRRNDGLEIRFSGTENIAFASVRQFTTVSTGRYRFSAKISAEDLTTDQGPLFHIFDPANPGRVNVESRPAKGTVGQSWITLEVPVPPGTQALQIQVERRPSQKFDNKIGGLLHLYQVSLLPVR